MTMFIITSPNVSIQCEVLFLPKWCGREHDSSCESNSGPALPEGFEGLIVSGDTTDESLQNAVFPPAHVPLNTASSNTRFESLKHMCTQFFDFFPIEKNIVGVFYV